ncbi:MAG: GHKL domain-containing protein [Chitinophagaceae bacterium]|nr:MAG: GHKL domain-containing protein [Chitinophagaceae bacterium]
MKFFCLIGLLCLPTLAFCASDTTFINVQSDVLLQNNHILIFRDQSGQLPFEKIKTIDAFLPPAHHIPNLGVSRGVIWLKFTLYNETNNEQLLICLKKPNLNEVRLYYPIDSKGSYTYINSGDLLPPSTHKFNDPNSIFTVPIQPYSAATLYIRVKSIGQIVLPVIAGTQDNIVRDINNDRLIFGIYLGIILIMLFYNFFIYFSVRDKNYLYYIIYIFFIGFAQIGLEGYGYQYLWGSSTFIILQSVNWMGVLSGIATTVFLRVFLQTKKKTPLFDKVLIGFIILYVITGLLTLFGIYNLSYTLIDIIAFTGSFAFLGAGVKMASENYRPAKFFLVAWSFFLASIILYVVKDFGIIPYNFFTNNILLIGSSIEIALLSFALADTINVYKKEKEISQAQAIQALREKEEFASQQNVILEKKIHERTNQLQETNNDLELTLRQLKESQSQLVDAEKMASLGQLTAGIAHEINNPINFVKSNVKPLQLDIEDMRSLIKKYEEMHHDNFDDKHGEIQAFREQIDFDYVMEEINTLLSGIEDGATRTADIVKGLRTFSRLDESDLKEADIREGIDNTLMLLNHTIPKDLSIIRNYQEIPKIECYPGKLNQVFMNLLTNAIQAMGSSVGGGEKKIIISTERLNENVVIRIADTGPGIPENVRDRIFEPFFTTKDVGEGTGLGLSIVYNIIEKHHGKITVQSEENKGTEFIITLPMKQSDFLDVNTTATTSDSEEPLNR